MWTQYTRESPAKRGWALGGMVIAFVATVGLAQLTVGHRKAGDRQELEGWPITFKLPKSGHWMRARDLNFITGLRRKYEASFAGRTEGKSGPCLLRVACEPDSEGPALVDYASKVGDALLGIAQPIRIGPFKGVMTTRMDEEGMLMVNASATDGKKFEVSVVLYGDGSKSTMTKMIREVCESVEVKDGAKGQK